MPYISTQVAGSVTRFRDRETGLGLMTSDLPPYAASGAVLTSQAVYGVAEYFYAGDVITNIVACCTTAAVGTAPTFLKCGVWSSAATPVCLAITGDLSAAASWTAGWRVNALSAPLTITTSGIYYLAIMENGAFSGTPVQLATGGVSGTFGTAIGANPQRYGTLKTAAASMAVTDTGTYGTAGTVPWLGAS